MDNKYSKFTINFVHKFLLAILFAVVFFIPRIINLDVFMATDEGAWTYRAANFYYALGQREFENTYTSTHPGIVTSWVGTAALLIDFPEYRGLNQGYFEDYYGYEDFLEAHGVSPHDLLVTSRIVMVVFLTVALGMSFYLSLELFGLIFTLFSFFLIAFDPLFLAISRTYHLDAPMASLILLSMLSLLLYYKQGGNRIVFLLFSGFIAGTAVLAKLTSGVYAVSAVIVIASYPFLFAPDKERELGKVAKQVLLKVLAWGGAAALGMVVFWPVLWVKPVATFVDLITYAVGASSGSVGASSAYVEPTTFFFYNPLQQSFMNYPASFMWRTTPIVIIGLMAALVGFIQKKYPWRQKGFKGSVFGLLVFIAIYTLVMSVAVKQSQKYYLPAILMINLIAGFGLATLPALMERVGQKAKSWRIFIGGGAAILLAVQLLLVLPTHPYYFTYYNPMLGGPSAASENIFVGTGEGLNLAGEYLNKKPNAEDLKVLAWYGTGCLSYFFEGEVEIIDLDDVWSEDEQVLLKNSDYLVTYSNQWFRNRPAELLNALEGIQPEHTVWLQGIEYAHIYATNQLPTELFGD